MLTCGKCKNGDTYAKIAAYLTSIKAAGKDRWFPAQVQRICKAGRFASLTRLSYSFAMAYPQCAKCGSQDLQIHPMNSEYKLLYCNTCGAAISALTVGSAPTAGNNVSGGTQASKHIPDTEFQRRVLQGFADTEKTLERIKSDIQRVQSTLYGN